jgi:hypothetical protein
MYRRNNADYIYRYDREYKRRDSTIGEFKGSIIVFPSHRIDRE